jgi:hypothetical protein
MYERQWMKLTALLVISGELYFAIWDEMVCQNVTSGRIYSMFMIIVYGYGYGYGYGYDDNT